MGKTKVLMVGPALNMKGGIASVNSTLVQSKQEEAEIIYVASYVDGNMLNKLVAAFFGICKMLMLLIINNVKVVHVHSASRGSFRRKLSYFLLAKLFRKSIIYHIHGAEFIIYYQEANSLEKKVIKGVLTGVEKVIALSNTWREDLFKIAPKANIEVVYNPVCIEEFNKPKDKEGQINIVFMGRLGERKGVYDLLEVIPNIVRKHESVTFHLCGDGDVEKVKHIVKEKGLQEHVFVPGWVGSEEKANYFNNGSIYILPSYNEGLPISILEAMACSLPIIATNVGGIPEAVDHGKNGYLIKPGDKVYLEKYLVELIESRELRYKYGQYSLKKCQENFDINIVMKKVNSLYKEVLE